MQEIIECEDSEPALTEEDLRECERALGHPLPTVAVNQLQAFNGGQLVKRYYVDTEGMAWSVDTVLPVAPKGKTLDNDLVSEAMLLRSRGVSHDYLPFIDDEGGEAVCINLNDGSIWLIEHIHYSPPQMTKIALTWESFTAGLMTNEEAEELGAI